MTTNTHGFKNFQTERFLYVVQILGKEGVIQTKPLKEILGRKIFNINLNILIEHFLKIFVIMLNNIEQSSYFRRPKLASL